MAALYLFLFLFLALAAGAPAQASLSGKWYWRGAAGWQRITLDLRPDGKKLSGTIVMGPGDVRNAGADQYWELFFQPASFPILNGKIDGSKISFEQAVFRGDGAEERLKYAGTLDGDRLVLGRQSERRPDDRFVLGDHEFQFTATRNAAPPQASAPAPPGPAAARRAMGMHVMARDDSGRNVDGLSAADFVVLENGVPRPVASFAPAESAMNLLFLFDHNLTWLEEGAEKDSPSYVANAWRGLIDTVSNVIGRLRPDDQFAVAAFEDRVQVALDWRPARNAGQSGSRLTVTDAPAGQKDLYGAIHWALKKFEGKTGRKTLVLFTDGRDGRLSPRWLRPAPETNRGRGGNRVVVFGPVPQRGLVGGPVIPESSEVLDPLYGLHDAAEAWEFQRLLSAVSKAGVEIHVVAVGAGHDPQFGPAVVGRRISGLYPGANAVLDGYLAGTRERLEMLAAATGGQMHFGAGRDDAKRIYSTMDRRVGLGAYRVEVELTEAGSARTVEVRALKEGLRVSPLAATPAP